MSLETCMLTAFERARALGALRPLETQARTVVEAGLPLELRCVAALHDKDRDGHRAAGAPRRNPFLPYDPSLFVADIEGLAPAAGGESSHVLLLNKFPVVEGHVLLVTRDFRDQLVPPSLHDFVAISRVLLDLGGLVFFNGGPLAGASQPHWHYQRVPLEPLPIAPALAEGPACGSVPRLRFRHAFVRLPDDAQASVTCLASALQQAFQTAAALLGLATLPPQLPPMNLLLTRDWLMWVPRSREVWSAGEARVSFNALGFAGKVLLRSPEHGEALVQHGVLRALESVTL